MLMQKVSACLHLHRVQFASELQMAFPILHNFGPFGLAHPLSIDVLEYRECGAHWAADEKLWLQLFDNFHHLGPFGSGVEIPRFPIIWIQN